MLKRSNKGFTLIELMIVIAIIGILLAIAIPNFKAFRDRKLAERAAEGIPAKKVVKVIAGAIQKQFADTNGIVCQDGEKVIVQDGIVYHVGLKDSWGDVKPQSCE